ncbi:uncharacterized protein A4U43_C07F19400 [Asparagus officinalis]|uniref:Glutaredoxin domain-containing protein n=1 Tax=Asparagus officinalis TaxID=4686 RepID=A0A5P1EDA7_ASPOF|nr:monothiol glutaredoxin-S10-like [Asparagus officinalis]ONK63832.1 uncharacterized protein A4U43_C07F19400 [Asparagus officinalis]
MAVNRCDLMRPTVGVTAAPETARCRHLPLPVTAISPPPAVLRSSPIYSYGHRRTFAVRSMCSKPASFGSRLEDSVKKTVAENPVVIYSKSWCSYSMEVKSLFRRIGVEPLVIELDQLGPQGHQLQKLLERLTGQFTVPNVFIGGKHIGGCTDTVRLHHKGELTTLLSELNIKTKSLQKP